MENFKQKALNKTDETFTYIESFGSVPLSVDGVQFRSLRQKHQFVTYYTK